MSSKKRCSNCKSVKSATEFYKDASRKDGLQCVCKACKATYNAAHKSERAAYFAHRYLSNRVAFLAECTARYQRNKERACIQRKARYAATREKTLATNAAYRAANPEAIAAMKRAYCLANPETVRASKSKVRARRRSAGGSHTGADIKELMRLQRGKCPACGADIRRNYHVDHVDALVAGGTNARSNLQLLCPKCNQQKNRRHSVDFMQTKGFLL